MAIVRSSAVAAATAGLLLLSACSSTADTASGGSTTTAADAPGTTTGPAGPGTSAVAPDATPVTLDDATRSELDALFAQGFEAAGVTGATARVTIGGQTWAATAGVDDLGTGAPFVADNHVRIASITKTYTANAILQLVDEGELSLDDTLEQHIPGIANGAEITIEDLLAMRSGVWDFTADDDLVARFDADPMFAWTPEQTIELIKAQPADFAPGEKVVYCDSNYVLLGRILEQITGMTASEAINTMVIDRLGLQDTDFPAADQPGVPAPATTGHLPAPEGSDAAPTIVGDVNPQFAWTAGAITSTVDDLEAWGVELGDGTLLTPETQARRLRSEPFDGQELVGYGLGILTINDVVGHNGAIIGFSSIVLRYPEADATIVVVANESTNFSTPATDIAFAFLGALYPAQLPAAPAR